MSSPQPRPGRTGSAKRVLVGLAALGACIAATGCATYRAERAQFESKHVTVYPTSPSSTFTSGQMASVSDR